MPDEALPRRFTLTRGHAIVALGALSLAGRYSSSGRHRPHPSPTPPRPTHPRRAIGPISVGRTTTPSPPRPAWPTSGPSKDRPSSGTAIGSRLLGIRGGRGATVHADADAGGPVRRVPRPRNRGGTLALPLRLAVAARRALPRPLRHADVGRRRIYYSAPDGSVGCVEAETGRAVWSVNVLRRFKGSGAEFGYACTPLVEAGRVILPVGGPGASLVALRCGGRDRPCGQSGDDAGSYSSGPADRRRRPALGRRLPAQLPWWPSMRRHGESHAGARRSPRSYDEHSAWPLWADPRL